MSDLIELNDAEKFLKFIPPGSEAGVCLVGEADFVDHVVSAFVRLSEGREMGLQVRILFLNSFFCAATDIKGNSIKGEFRNVFFPLCPSSDVPLTSQREKGLRPELW